MNYRHFLLKIAPYLRSAKSLALATIGRVAMIRRRFSGKSPKGLMVLLSLGGGKGSPFVAGAVRRAGFDLCVVSKSFPARESVYANSWINCDPFGDFETLREKIAAENPVAVLVEQRNILLPVKAKLNAELGLVDYGDKSHRTSNSKIALRSAIDDAGEPNIKWCLLDDYNPDVFPLPYVIKPETGTGSRGITVVENQQDVDLAMQKLDELGDDETVGGRVFVEEVIRGRQFDVEGVYLDGKCYPLSLTEEHYDQVGNALPSSWYLFSPPVGEETRSKLLDAAERFTKALGVRNGAFHCEMRLDAEGGIYAIDYSNRMGYPLLVSECCGYYFPEEYVKVMAGITPDHSALKQRTVFQRFIRSQAELAGYRALMDEYPEMVIEKRMLGSMVGGVETFARIALRSEDFTKLSGALAKHNIVPGEWYEYYDISKAPSGVS